MAKTKRPAKPAKRAGASRLIEPAPRALQAALDRYHAAQYAEAAALAAAITRRQPGNAEAWKVLGVALKQTGQSDESLQAMRQAAKLAPADAEAHYNLGVCLQEQGRAQEASACYRQALRCRGDYAEAHNNLGTALQDLDCADAARQSHRRALAVRPGYAEAYNNLGNACSRLGPTAEAQTSYARALRLLPEYAAAHNNLGNLRRAGGDLAGAADSYRLALRFGSQLEELHSNLGNVLKSMGKLDAARASYRCALVLKPDHEDLLGNLGVTLQELGLAREAEACYRRALALRCEHPEANNNLGRILMDQGKMVAAQAQFQLALAAKPDYAGACNNLGNSCHGQGRLAAAIAWYRRALRLDADFAVVHNNLGNALRETGDLAEAQASLRLALGLQPQFADASSNLGNVLKLLGRLDAAVQAYRVALALQPGHAMACSNLGAARHDQGRLDQAESSYRRALLLDPDYQEAHNNLGNTLRDLGRLQQAQLSYLRALCLDPAHAEAHNNLGNAQKDGIDLDRAEACFRRALSARPAFAEAHSNLLFTLNYQTRLSPAEVYAEHLLWQPQQAAPFVAAPRPALTALTAGRRLRIGYVSPDLRQHSVAYFFEPLLREHDRQTVESFCYAEVLRPDAVTARLRSLADHWLDTTGLSDRELAQHIAADRIDVLVDMAGHSAHNRLRVFAQRPAPLQLSWLGYPHSTGLAAIDYRLVDAITDPPGVADALASETLLRLEQGFLCYGPPAEAPPLAEPPCLCGAVVTFASFNNPAKLSAQTLDLWAALLRRLPEARLLLKGRLFGDAEGCAHLLAQMAQRGVAAERLSLVGSLPGLAQHLQLYGQVDIGLDPFPYNGTTTTCEALWMGVPVVTLCGDRHAGRVGASLLAQLGLEELVATNREQYLEIACALARDRQRLRQLRQGLRARMAHSPLGDAPAFARKMESVYRAAWQAEAGDSDSLPTLFAQRRWREAVQAAQVFLARGRAQSLACKILAGALYQLGRCREALQPARRALAYAPQDLEANNILASLQHKLGDLPAAERTFRRAIALNPQFAEAHNNRGSLLRDLVRPDAVAASFHRALVLKPDYAEACNNLGNALKDLGKMAEAGDSYRRALQISPHYPEAGSNFLYCLNYQLLPAEQVYAEHRRWAMRLEKNCAPVRQEDVDWDVERRLRIGLVSPDLRQHSVAHFLEPLLREYDRRKLEVYCYAEVLVPDAVSRRFASYSQHWRCTVGMADDALALQIAADRIDILIDLAGHTAHNRLPVFARRPAPVQVTWLGYPHSTGMTSIDYRLVDAVTDPQGNAATFSSETLVRMPQGFLCFAPFEQAPLPDYPPSLSRPGICFGSFNNPAKLSAPTLDAWAALLQQLPDARLLLKGKIFADAQGRAPLLAALRRRGVDPERVTLLGTMPSLADHLALYARVDIALDPFPYNGTTTTCEALWMGVPVVTLRGDRHAGRVGASLLAQLGLEDLVADSLPQYIDIALKLAGDQARRLTLRRSLRQSLGTSSLGDAAAFARKMEDTLRRLWRHRAAEESLVPMPPATASSADAEAQNSLGDALLDQGRLVEAEAAYRAAVRGQADYAVAYDNLGTLLKLVGRLGESLPCYRQALICAPALASAHSNLGGALKALGSVHAAEISYRRALQTQPDLAEVLVNQSSLFQDSGRLDEAAAVCLRAVEIKPELAEAYCNLGAALTDLSRLREAEASCVRALQIRPDYAKAHGNLGNALFKLGRLDEAAAHCRRALEISPDLASGHSNLGNALKRGNESALAIVAYRRALAIKPDLSEARFNLSLALLAAGQLGEGWACYEERFATAPRRPFGEPEWMGEALSGKRILVWGEQGIGDELMFASLYQEVIAQAQGCVIECAPKLVLLFARNFPGAQVVAKTDPPHPATQGGFDYQSACGSLARWLRPTLASFPQRERYLEAAPQRLGYWREKLAALGPGLKVGFSWRSKIMTGVRPLYCTKLEEWGPIFAVAGVHFVNLQYDQCAEELKEAEARFGVTLHAFEEVDLYDDIEETMALTQALDLVITAPTVVSVMSGALGVPTYMMTYGVLLETLGSDCSPWFPNLLPFVRPWDSGWEQTIDAVARRLLAPCHDGHESIHGGAG